jgi:hypothetical protein
VLVGTEKWESLQVTVKQYILHLNIKWEGERMEKVAKMEYLGTIMNVNGKIDKDINNRVQKANNFTKK